MIMMMMMIKTLPQLNDLALDRQLSFIDWSSLCKSFTSVATGNSCMPNGGNFKRNKTVDCFISVFEVATLMVIN